MADIRIPRARAPTDWASADLASIARVLQETTGLIFPPNRQEPAEAGMRRTMEQLGLDAFDLRRAIAMPGEARDALVTQLTVGETFFFRESGQLDFLRDHVLPALREQVGITRPLRIWSAGSATGEEAYSLAMVLREAGWQWPATILGTDLVPARLAVARKARYTQWSMRGVPEELTERYFEKRSGSYMLREEIRQSVEFRVLNLVADEYPSSASGVFDMDVIFCRNVLIYFDPTSIEAIARRLLASLAPHGWLFLGASDPSISDIVPCEVVLTGAGLAYRRLAEGTVRVPHAEFRVPRDLGHAIERPLVEPFMGSGSHVALSAGPDVEVAHSIPGTPSKGVAIVEPEQSVESYDAAYARGDYEHAASVARRTIERGDATERPWTVLIRSLANEGKLDAAGEAAAAALDRHPMSAEVSYLNGMLLGQWGRHMEAATAFKRALYLDSQFAIAHLALGDALFSIGDVAAARRAYKNAESLLRAMDSDAVVPGADGLPAARLLYIARYHLQRIPDATQSRVPT